MGTDVKLPQFGMGMQEGTIVKWLRSEGDQVTAGEVIAEIEAAKAIEELTAPASGVLSRIIVPTDATVAVYTILAHIDSA